MARNNDYDVAYLITGDSDLAPAVEMVRQIGKEIVLVYFWIGIYQKMSVDSPIA